MSNPHAQINTAQEETSALFTVLNGQETGIPNVAVLFFTNAAATGPGVTAVSDAANGAVATVTRRGVYSISLCLPTVANDTVATGISLNVAAAGLTTDPVLATAGMLQAGVNDNPVNCQTTVTHETLVVVTEVAARAGAIFRGHATDNGDLAPGNAFTNADCSMRIVRCFDVLA